MTTALDHRLLALLTAAVDGPEPPGPPGGVEVIARPQGPSSAVTVLSGYAVVAADVHPGWVLDHLPPGFDEADEHHPALSVAFLGALATRLGTPPSGLSVLLGAPAAEVGDPGRMVEIDLTPNAWSDYRIGVRGYRYAGRGGSATVSIGLGPGGRWDIWIGPMCQEGPKQSPSPGELLDALRGLIPPRTPLFAAVPASSASALGHALAVGFRPLGAEILFHHEGSD